MAPWTFHQRLQNELDLVGQSGFLKGAFGGTLAPMCVVDGTRA